MVEGDLRVMGMEVGMGYMRDLSRPKKSLHISSSIRGVEGGISTCGKVRLSDHQMPRISHAALRYTSAGVCSSRLQ